jgi:hypothetical protein
MNISYNTQNNLLLNNLLEFYKDENNLNKFIKIITGESKISLRIIDWFVTNYSKKYYTTYIIDNDHPTRFKVYIDYKLRLKAYSKEKMDAFCRFSRISIPFKNNYIETTIGQMNFFSWAIKNKIIEYVEENYDVIEKDMNSRNSTSKKKEMETENNTKTRKKRQELSLSATKSIKKENVEITIKFN